MRAHPPAVPRALLRLSVATDAREEIEGDLLELFEGRIAESGIWRARVRYWHDVFTILAHMRRTTRSNAHGAGRRSIPEAIVMMLSVALAEAKHALRVLARSPGYSIVAALTLALGIGANVAVFSLANAVLLRPLPYPESERIMSLRHHAPGMGMPDVQNAPGLVVQYREHARTLTAVAGYRAQNVNLADGGAPARVRTLSATPDLLTVLATAPALGRPLRTEDAQPNAPRVALLTHGLWQSRFGGDPGVVGRTVRIDDVPAEVIGVMPPGFAFPDATTGMIVPMHIDQQFGSLGLNAVARLAPNVSVEDARREITALQQRIPEWFPELTADVLAGFGWSVTIEPLRDRVVSNVSRTLWILFATVGFVLLIAGTNVANLFLIRAEGRQRELAVRAALGAGRGRLMATFLAESVLLAIAGGAAGLMLGAWAVRVLVRFGPAYLPRLNEVRIDPAVFVFAATLSLLAAVALALVPAAGLGSRRIVSVVRDSGRASTASKSRQRLRRALIVTQLATAMVLLVGSGLMVRSASRLSAIDPGFRPDGLLTAGVSPGTRIDRARGVAFYRQLLEELARLPGVQSVGAVSALPLAPGSLSGSIPNVKSRPRTQGEMPPIAMYTAVTANYFETLGVPVIEGRSPTSADVDQDRPVAWVNQTFVKHYLGERRVGEEVQVAERWLEIVGIVGDLKTFELRDDAKPMIYVPLGNPLVGLDVMHAVMRIGNAPAPDIAALRSAVDAVNPTVPLTAVKTMDAVLADSMAQMSFTVALLSVAAGAALALGIVGLYGVISYAVSQRTAEIGIRLALGASPSEVSALVLRQGLIVIGAGVAIGLAASAASTRFMAALLVDVSTKDPATFAAAAAILTVVGIAATYLPARRAAAIDPALSLRRQE